MTPNQHQTHIPLIVQEAAKIIDLMISNQQRTDYRIQMMDFPIEDRTRHQLFKAADDINKSLWTIRFLAFTQVTEKGQGYNASEGIPHEPESKIPDNIYLKDITHPLIHEPIGYPLWPDTGITPDEETYKLNKAIERTSYTYTKIYEFNQQTDALSTSKRTQDHFDEAMNCAYTRLKLQYHILLKARDVLEFNL